VPFGANSSYLALGKRTPVYGSDGRLLGVVKKVECDRKNDIFDGLVLSTPHGDRYLLAEHVTAVHEDAVEACVSAEQLEVPSAVPTLATEGFEHHVSWGELWHWLAVRLGFARLDDPRVHQAEARLHDRARALRLAREHPALALEAGIGRPDIRGAFHGEVIDVNNASAGALASLPGISHRLALRIVGVRTRVGGFSSLEDMGLVLDLDGDQVERLRDLVVFLPQGAHAEPGDEDLDDASGTPA
jgi:Helix-hairpin-helix motif